MISQSCKCCRRERFLSLYLDPLLILLSVFVDGHSVLVFACWLLQKVLHCLLVPVHLLPELLQLLFGLENVVLGIQIHVIVASQSKATTTLFYFYLWMALTSSMFFLSPKELSSFSIFAVSWVKRPVSLSTRAVRCFCNSTSRSFASHRA